MRVRWLPVALLFAAGAVPIQLVTLSFGYAQWGQGITKGPPMFAAAREFAAPYLLWAYLPAVLLVVWFLATGRRSSPSLWRRLGVGLGAGALATLALDAARGAAVIYGWLPGDSPLMFGRLATGSSEFAAIYGLGLAIHYANGANFGVVFAFLAGKRNSLAAALAWGIGWGLVVELGMMTLPPMAPLVGPFGRDFAWPALFLATLVAHLLFGAALGALSQSMLTDSERGPVELVSRGGGPTVAQA